MSGNQIYDMSGANPPKDWHTLDSEIVFNEIYNTYWKKLFVVAYNRLNDKQEAEDVLHDVFVSLWVNRDKIKIRMLENYLTIAVKNQVFTKLRKKCCEEAYIKSLNMEASSEQHIVTSIHNKQLLENVRNEIENLPEKCRIIFKCSRNEGMPVKQIARLLNISPKTVENQLNKALQRLKLTAKSFLHLFLIV